MWLQGSLLRDWEKAGGNLKARGDGEHCRWHCYGLLHVFSFLKFDFHDLFGCWPMFLQCHSQHWVRLCFPC